MKQKEIGRWKNRESRWKEKDKENKNVEKSNTDKSKHTALTFVFNVGVWFLTYEMITQTGPKINCVHVGVFAVRRYAAISRINSPKHRTCYNSVIPFACPGMVLQNVDSSSLSISLLFCLYLYILLSSSVR